MQEFLELKETWKQLKPVVEVQISSTYQAPVHIVPAKAVCQLVRLTFGVLSQAIRVLLRHRVEQVESLLVKLNRYMMSDKTEKPDAVRAVHL